MSSQRSLSKLLPGLAVGASIGAVLVMGAAGARRAAGHSQWDVVTISGSSQFNPATNSYRGAGTILLNGATSALSWESVILGTLSQADDGTLTLIGSHTFFSTAHGRRFEFTTFDTITAVPTAQPGIYTLSSHLVVDDGSGLFSRGQIVAAGGLANFATGAVTIPSSTGKLARN